MSKKESIHVKGTEITVISEKNSDYISLTDIARVKNPDANGVIANWMRNRNTIEYLGIWEYLYNPNFKPLDFEGFKNEAKTKRGFDTVDCNLCRTVCPVSNGIIRKQ
jgi:hypothetical protein